jgi:hypothetical protein
LLTRGGNSKGFAGFKPSVLKELVAGPKRAWQKEVERNASEIYPLWREHFQEQKNACPMNYPRSLRLA